MFQERNLRNKVKDEGTKTLKQINQKATIFICNEGSFFKFESCGVFIFQRNEE
jgi:hypothetical protein